MLFVCCCVWWLIFKRAIDFYLQEPDYETESREEMVSRMIFDKKW